ncbi:hypothetical protein ACFR9U_04845 [Halorientalis brevis]|uniref:LPP20 lipoprotein n=1 Tax=Halorientalis brevis TaxID=1126241 RepID=A0ABD6C8U0_9EURY|nr:hypothetical protein [Halorientalis brevis]
MRLTLPALVALLVAVATVTAGTPVPLPPETETAVGPSTGQATVSDAASTQSVASPIDPLQNTTDYLALPGQTRANAQFGNGTLDVTGTVAAERSRLQTELNESATLKAFQAADSTTARTAIVERAVNRIENRTETLRTRQQRAITAYNRGDLSTDAFLQRLAVVDTEASQLRQYIDGVLRRTGRTPGYSLPNDLKTRLESVKVEPTVLQGPIRTSVTQTMAGESDELDVYVETTSDGVVLARLSGGRYVREAFLASEYQQPGPDQFAQSDLPQITAAYERALKLYPWAFNNSITSTSVTGYGSTSAYQINVDHSQGVLTSYLDGTTTNVFREVQEKRLSRLAIARNATNRTSDLTITAGLTHESGPMNVTVADTVTGDPVDARITVDGQFVGETGLDGSRWTIRPHGPVTVNATTSTGEHVTLDLGGASPGED